MTPKQRPLFICQILMNYGVLQFLELLHNSDLSLLLNTFLSARYAFYYCIFLGGGEVKEHILLALLHLGADATDKSSAPQRLSLLIFLNYSK